MSKDKTYLYFQAGDRVRVHDASAKTGYTGLTNYIADLWTPLIGTDVIGYWMILKRYSRANQTKSITVRDFMDITHKSDKTLKKFRDILNAFKFIKVRTPTEEERRNGQTILYVIIDPPEEVTNAHVEYAKAQGWTPSRQDWKYKPLCSWSITDEIQIPDVKYDPTDFDDYLSDISDTVQAQHLSDISDSPSDISDSPSDISDLVVVSSVASSIVKDTVSPDKSDDTGVISRFANRATHGNVGNVKAIPQTPESEISKPTDIVDEKDLPQYVHLMLAACRKKWNSQTDAIKKDSLKLTMKMRDKEGRYVWTEPIPIVYDKEPLYRAWIDEYMIPELKNQFEKITPRQFIDRTKNYLRFQDFLKMPDGKAFASRTNIANAGSVALNPDQPVPTSDFGEVPDMD